MKILSIPKVIYIYNEGIKEIDFEELKKFIQRTFGNLEVHFVRLKEKVVQTRSLLFDFIGTQKTFDATSYSEVKDACHIILTSKLFATYNEQKKIHIRAAIFGFPSIISTSGIVEGPAKPKEYYLYKQRYAQLGIWEIEEAKLKRKFKGRFIDYEDKRMIETIKGYVAQALFFYITGEPFCKKKICRLYNAHWQSDLIFSQIKSGRFCKRHQGLSVEIKQVVMER